MFLTQLRLDPRSAQVRRDLADPYDMHRTLARAFTTGDGVAPSRFLWRVESEGQWAEPVVLVQGAYPGNWSALEALPGYLKGGVQAKTVALDRFVQTGERYRFRFFANPTVTRDGKRYGLAVESAQLDWLRRQGEKHGFAVDVALVTASDLLRGRKGAACIQLHRACFEGVLLVADASALGCALVDGIGPGKAFGCGLLSLARC